MDELLNHDEQELLKRMHTLISVDPWKLTRLVTLAREVYDTPKAAISDSERRRERKAPTGSYVTDSKVTEMMKLQEDLGLADDWFLYDIIKVASHIHRIIDQEIFKEIFK